MSTDYITIPPIRFADLLDGRLERSGVFEYISAKTTEDVKCLTDRKGNFLWVCSFGEENYVLLTRYASSGCSELILEVIEEAFDTFTISEHHPWHYGFVSEADQLADHEAKSKIREDGGFYVDVLNFIANRPNNIRLGTNEEVLANIGARLIAADPQLAEPAKQNELMEAILSTFRRDHVNYLTDQYVEDLRNERAAVNRLHC
jgi:hypothetical protein